MLHTDVGATKHFMLYFTLAWKLDLAKCYILSWTYLSLLVMKQETRLASGQFQYLTFGINLIGNSLNSETNSETLIQIKLPST